MAQPLLRIENLRTWIDTGDAVVRAVDGVSLDIPHGETFALVGESGCGKSLTALSVMRLQPDAGQIVGGKVELNGEDLLALPETRMRDVRGARIAMIFQEPMLSLNPVMTVGAQIAETLRRHTDLEGAALDHRVLELLDAVRIPDGARRRHEYAFQLSGGKQQRVMIATAHACDPELLIADEPTTALDATIQAQVLELLCELQSRRKMSVLLITHDLAVVAQMARRVAVMYAGQIVENADRETFFSRPAHPYSRKLFDSLPGKTKRGDALAVIRGTVPPLTREFVGCRFAERCDHAWDLCRDTTPPWYEIGGGQGVRCHLFAEGEQMREGRGERREGKKSHETAESVAIPASRLPPISSLLEVSDLKVHFPIHKGVFKRVVGHVKAVDGVSFAIERGRTLGLVGESGCGKTTVGKGLLRLVESTAGQVLFDGEDFLRLPRAQLRPRRRHAQIIFQDPYASLNPRMRVMETIEEGMAALGIGADRAARQARIDQLLGEVGLTPEVKYRYPHEFSGGQRQRIAIARALAVEPQLIVCDEPTSALDVSVQAQILNLLKDLQAKKGLAYLFITHNISVIEFLAHEVAVMYLGRVVERGTMEEVLENPKHPYTRVLLSAVPVLDRKTKREVIRLQGDLPSPVNPPPGCHFHPRCPAAMPQCKIAYPEKTRFTATHSTHCHLYPPG
ncbi:MAG: dipeptide ABC transporter ATP-binding protein [Betaproteobacteria bacterium]|nr:dipeptide ABC transporter ATP-binding protein [Betaproteobacteria bacterium]